MPNVVMPELGETVGEGTVTKRDASCGSGEAGQHEGR